MRIELLWFDDCPNHERAGTALKRVLAGRGIDASVVQSIRVDASTAESQRLPGSPTIRINGRDVEPGFVDSGSYALSCRMYQTSRGLQGIPEDAWIERAIEEAGSAATEER